MADNAALLEAQKRGLKVPAAAGQQESPALLEARKRGLVPAQEPMGPPAPRPRMIGGKGGAVPYTEQADLPVMDRIGQGLMDVGFGVDQLVARTLLPEGDPQLQHIENYIGADNRAYENQRHSAGAGPDDFDAARAVGNALPVLPAALIAPEGVIPALAAGAASGGLSAATQPIYDTSQGDFWQQKGINTAIGAGTGAVVQGAGAGVAKAIAPKVAPHVKELMGRGVTPTPGQILGGAAQTAEEKAASIPLLGSFIRGGQRRAVEDLNRAAFDEALAPIGVKVGAIGREGMEQAKTAIDDAYGKVLPSITFQADAQFTSDVANLVSMADHLPPTQAARFKQLVQDRVQKTLGQTGIIDGRSFQDMDSALGFQAARYSKAQDPDVQDLGAALFELQATLRETAERGNPQFAPELAKAREAAKNLFRVEQAVGKTGQQTPGVFSPAQLQQSVKSMDSSVRKSHFARGEAPMQNVSDAGVSVLGSKYPDSGTAGRTLLGLAAAGGGYIKPTTAIATGALTLPYTKIGQKALAAALTKRPKGAPAVADTVRALTPAARQALIGSLLGSGATDAP